MSKELKIKKGSIYDVKHHIKIQRSYKSLCSMEDCYFTTHTKNHRRVGGLCLMCRSRILSSSKIIRWYRKRFRHKKFKETLNVFLVFMRCMPRNSGGGIGIPKIICNFL